ncbi:anaerobic ribonucleoside-triphosphate reductase activating protein [Peptacetobacter sp.]|uniref:anaerobic ribonucleoside-triphosphate reductase activating protein n=1 Tax=Peptacetobacter sp. TaxID=2991975 RepID=UPI0026213017|nr:anaerobic ribonucleoside-triphosphate reductase activating protein [Peptacetobacter sp.]
MDIRIASDITFDSIVDGPGLRAVVWSQGCKHNCIGCHNPQTHSLKGGKIVDTREIIDKIKSKKLQSGVTLSGGEPFLQADAMAEIAIASKEMGLNVWSFTGFVFEDLIDKKNINYFSNMKLLKNIDVLVDGKFEENKKDISLKFRGSANQRIIDVQKSLKLGKIIIREEYTENYIDTFLPMAK